MNKRSKSELNLKLAQENAQLISKIQRSKPILETIYDKVKRKQRLLYDKINRDKRLITDYKTAAKDYKKLYEESIQIIQKNKIIDKFQHSLGNFIKTRPKKPGKQPLKSKSLYEQYRERIEKEEKLIPEEKNPELEALKKQNQQLKNQMIEDIDKLKLVRAKSQKALAKTKSTSFLRPPRPREVQIDEQIYKKRLAERQNKRLQRVEQ